MAEKCGIICNGTEPKNVYPTFIIGSTAASLGYEVVLFFIPGGGKAMEKGFLEEMSKAHENMPDLLDMLEAIKETGGKILTCELVTKLGIVKKEDLRDDTRIVSAAEFLGEIAGADITFAF
ncbi:MAG TPA: peroxiredoxin [Candidatus Altiarchaeales archaeon]|nr:MAG: peroxiredoxin [Deltaproteobacteria bacterium]HDH41916.1 peroxiredoxin [Candidatus Altiarchaeales archaeon]